MGCMSSTVTFVAERRTGAGATFRGALTTDLTGTVARRARRRRAQERRRRSLPVDVRDGSGPCFPIRAAVFGRSMRNARRSASACSSGSTTKPVSPSFTNCSGLAGVDARDHRLVALERLDRDEAVILLHRNERHDERPGVEIEQCSLLTSPRNRIRGSPSAALRRRGSSSPVPGDQQRDLALQPLEARGRPGPHASIDAAGPEGTRTRPGAAA